LLWFEFEFEKFQLSYPYLFVWRIVFAFLVVCR
jgi:hypothetical protein